MNKVALLFFATSCCGLSLPVMAQPYPAKPVRVVVPTVPGPLDAFARAVLEKAGDKLKQPFVIENRPGAGGNLGAETVAKAAPDGYTLLFAIDTTLTVNPLLYKKLGFDAARDFVPISVPVTYSQLLAVNPTVKVNSVADLVAMARQRPLSYATGGNGSPSHLSMASFLSTAGIDMAHIPYKGTGQSVIDVVGGQVESIFAVVGGVAPQVKAGKLKPLGVSGKERSGLLPEVPTIAESGYPGFNATFAYALMAPAGTPDDIVRALSREVLAALALPDLAEKNRGWDYVATGLNPAQSGEWLVATRRKWADVIRRNNIALE